MPDLDDIFEDIFDAAQKFIKKRNQKNKADKKRDAKERQGKDGKAKPRSNAPERLYPEAQSPTHPQQTVPSASRGADGKAIKSSIKSAELRHYLDQATSYERGIVDLLRNAPTEFNRTRIEQLSHSIDHWRQSLHALVQRVDQFQQNELLQNDLKNVPKAIERLETQLEEGVPDKVAQELRRTLNNRQNQLASLQQLSETMQWAEVKIENTVSMLGTIYSQSIMSQSTGQVSNYQTLLTEIEEESQSLDDYVTTLEEIKFGESF